MEKSFFNKIASIVLTIVLLAYSFKTVTVIANFAIHQDEIAKTLCEQKDAIEQNCQGKCQLVKALKSDLNQTQDIPLENIEILKVLSNYLQPKNQFNFDIVYGLMSSTDFNNTTKNIIKMDCDIITPPPKKA